MLEADARERALFPTLDATLARAGALAAPPNRLRAVHRISADGATWYLKVFQRTQWKNAVALRFSAPRARSEAEREARMAAALRARGQGAPRPVALGHAGASSYFLCAALSGTSLRDTLAEGRGHDLLLAAAAASGSAFAQGFCMPDLSAEHVFVAPGPTERPAFAFLDLHNAHVGAPSDRDVRRALRHSATSLRGLPIPPRLALRAALTFLRAAGAGDARPLLRALPPWHTHARYDAAGKSAAYAERNAARTRRELALLLRVWPGAPGDRVLDSPCGTGRLAAWLSASGAEALACDRSRAMLRRVAGYAACVTADAAMLPLADRCVHGAVVFRFLHHLDRRAARAVVAEAARVAERWLVLSVFHPWSAHAIWRRLRGAVTKRAATRFAHAPHQVARWLAPLGFALDRRARDGRFGELCVLSFRRQVDRTQDQRIPRAGEGRPRARAR